jgi:predicted GNAT superfamily acetyltransferase
VSPIRPLSTTDLGRVHAINEANVPAVGSVDLDRLQFLVDEAPIALVADVDSVVVGFCLVLAPGSGYDSSNYRWFAEHDDTAWYLDRVAFDPQARRRGLGTRMYAEVERRLVLHGVRRLGLEVNSEPPNVGSLAFHADRGFTELERRMTPYGIEVAMMIKHLNPKS